MPTEKMSTNYKKKKKLILPKEYDNWMSVLIFLLNYSLKSLLKQKTDSGKNRCFISLSIICGFYHFK